MRQLRCIFSKTTNGERMTTTKIKDLDYLFGLVCGILIVIPYVYCTIWYISFISSMCIFGLYSLLMTSIYKEK